MTLNLTNWQEYIENNLSVWNKKLRRISVNSLYYFLASLSLWPIVKTFRNDNRDYRERLSVLIENNARTELLSTIIEKIKKDDNETSFAKILQNESSPELVATLDFILEKLHVLQSVENSLEETDKHWFQKAIQEELVQHNSNIVFNATLLHNNIVEQDKNIRILEKKEVMVGENVQNSSIVTGSNNTVIYMVSQERDDPPKDETQKNYLRNLIAEHQHLRLQGIRAGSQPLSVSLEKVYVSLTIQDKHPANNLDSISSPPSKERLATSNISLSDALKRYRKLVIIGDPGCGKTTLLSYIALTYARIFLAKTDSKYQENVSAMQQRLGLKEGDHLPILLPLRALAGHLKDQNIDAGKDGPALLLEYLISYFQNQKILLHQDFFNDFLEKGKAVILLDGMDEIADKASRQRIARLIEKFSVRYPDCRFVVTSREVGYEGASRIGAEFGLAKIRDFSPSEVRQFIVDWTRVVETTLANSEEPEILRLADLQAQQLIQAIDTNPRVAMLAVNPLLLTVIALIHRYRAQLPERRSELYEEAVEVLLGHWDEGKGLDPAVQVAGIKLDSGDRRSILEPIAFWMHKERRREIELDELRSLLEPTFSNLVKHPQKISDVVNDFLRKINERSGLLVERGIGIYGFAHLTFQEYLSARELAGHDDALEFSVDKLRDPWWREVILLEAGYLSTQGKRRVSQLISAILNATTAAEPEPHHNLLLAAECIFDVGPARIEGDLLGQARQQLQIQADVPINKDDKSSLIAKLNAMNALARIESGKITSQFWKMPWGEPEWVTIPRGEFWSGSQDRNLSKIHLEQFQISRVPITNAQYFIYVQDTNAQIPEHWRGGDIPKGKENHPVTNVTWEDAINYCQWLGNKINKIINLPSNLEWEKAARGNFDQRDFPWGTLWKELHCNSHELNLNDTTPVGLFLQGASPYGVLDMCGNIWEWSRSEAQDNFHDTSNLNHDEISSPDVLRILRGGSYNSDNFKTSCTYSIWYYPLNKDEHAGFRIVTTT